MARDFSPITFFQRTPNALLGRYFREKYGALHEIAFDDLGESRKAAEAVFQAFTELPLDVTRMTLAARTKILFLWFKALSLWLKEPYLLWFAISVVAISLIFSLRHSVTEPEIRLVGLFLQVCGISTVVWDIGKTWKDFGHPSLIEKFHDWLNRRPHYSDHIPTGSAHIIGPPSIVNGRGGENSLVSTLPPHPIDKFQNEMDQNFRNQNELLWQAERTRVKDNQEILAKLETTETGGLHVAAMGVLWLTVGVILSTAAPEIARYFN